MHTRSIATVVADGRLVDREDLLRRTGTLPYVMSRDEDPGRLSARLRAVTEQRPDNVVNLVFRVNSYAEADDWPRIESRTPLRIVAVEGDRVHARGPAGAARWLTRTRFVLNVVLADEAH